MKRCEACGGSLGSCKTAGQLGEFRETVLDQEIPQEDFLQAIESAAKLYPGCADPESLRTVIRQAVTAIESIYGFPESDLPENIKEIIYSE